MKVAALYDVHGNLPALEAVLSEVEADVILCGGDLVLGPFPSECLELLRERGAIFIRGNGDRAVTGGGGEDDPWAERVTWVREQLTDEELDFIRTWPHPLALEVEGLGDVLFCHGSPRSDEEIITAITPPKRLDPILDGIRQEVVVCGHTHVQFDRRLGDRRLVNAGSVGMPYEGEAGIACWALLGPDVELRHAHYDSETAAVAILASGFPDAGGFVEQIFRAPTSAEEATAHFEAVAGAARD